MHFSSIICVIMISNIVFWVFHKYFERKPEHYMDFPIYPRVQQYLQTGMTFDDDRNIRDVNYQPTCAISAPASEQCIAAKLFETNDALYANEFCSRPFKVSESCVGL